MVECRVVGGVWNLSPIHFLNDCGFSSFFSAHELSGCYLLKKVSQTIHHWSFVFFSSFQSEFGVGFSSILTFADSRVQLWLLVRSPFLRLNILTTDTWTDHLSRLNTCIFGFFDDGEIWISLFISHVMLLDQNCFGIWAFMLLAWDLQLCIRFVCIIIS